jgi:hypothetical protein
VDAGAGGEGLGSQVDSEIPRLTEEVVLICPKILL